LKMQCKELHRHRFASLYRDSVWDRQRNRHHLLKSNRVIKFFYKTRGGAKNFLIVLKFGKGNF
jgi:hypothetical protein